LPTGVDSRLETSRVLSITIDPRKDNLDKLSFFEHSKKRGTHDFNGKKHDMKHAIKDDVAFSAPFSMPVVLFKHEIIKSSESTRSTVDCFQAPNLRRQLPRLVVAVTYLVRK
jgi:hypothetical protein